MSDFNGDSVAKAAEELIRTSGNWRHIVKHNAAVQSLYLGPAAYIVTPIAGNNHCYVWRPRSEAHDNWRTGGGG